MLSNFIQVLKKCPCFSIFFLCIYMKTSSRPRPNRTPKKLKMLCIHFLPHTIKKEDAGPTSYRKAGKAILIL